MRIAHIEYSVADLGRAADLFCGSFGCRVKSHKGDFLVLDPPEKPTRGRAGLLIRQFVGPASSDSDFIDPGMFAEFHMPPEIILSQSNSGFVGIHHVAYEVDNIKETSLKFRDLGIVEEGCSECRGMSCFTIKNSKSFMGLSIEVFSRNSGWVV